MPPQQYDPRLWTPPPPPQPAYPNYPDNILQPPFSNAYLPGKPSVPPGTLDADSTYKHFLNSGNYKPSKDRVEMVLTNSKIVSPKNINTKVDSPKSQDMEKSNIITSGEKFYEKMEKQIKDKSISRDSVAQKRESIHLESDE